jgi:hypothetical protein
MQKRKVSLSGIYPVRKHKYSGISNKGKNKDEQVGVLMDNAQLINQDSGDYEWYTPAFIVNAARNVMGYIALDPASSRQANKIVMADTIFTVDGLDLPWSDNVWLNHPFSRENNPLWINKAVAEYETGQAHQLMCITYAATSEKWFQPLTDYSQCYLVPRTNYYLPDGTKKKGVTKGSVVTYMGQNKDLFRSTFKGFGWMK